MAKKKEQSAAKTPRASIAQDSSALLGALGAILRFGDAGHLKVLGDLEVGGRLHAVGELIGELPADCVGSKQLKNNAVTSAQLAEADGDTGQNPELGAGVKRIHIQNGAITEEKLAGALRKKISGGREVVRVSFDESDADGTLRNIACQVQPTHLFAFGTMVSNLNAVTKPHGGQSFGYADASNLDAAQYSVGPVVHALEDGGLAKMWRSSALLSGGTDLAGVGLSGEPALAVGMARLDSVSEAALVQVDSIAADSVTFRLRRASSGGTLESGLRADLYVLLVG